MKKIALSLAGVLAATAFAPEASAVPAFARQTGMACAACHFQSYPALTGFGKSFKSAGFTMIGSQGKVEGDHGLSIPDTLNMGIYFQARYKKTNGSDVQPATGVENRTTNSGRIDLPDEFSLFAGGRVSENIGALLELSLTAGTGAITTTAVTVSATGASGGGALSVAGGATTGGAGGTGVAGFKLPIMFDMGGSKVGVIPFTVAGLGAQYGFDLFATGSTNNGRVIENGVGYSASMYLGTGVSASGAAIVVANDTFHASYTPWVQAANATNAGATGTKLGGNYIRLGWTPSMAGWDLGLGLMNWSGNSLKGVDGQTSTLTRDAATVIDFQGQGAMGGMPVGIYGSYGYAAANAGATNSNTTTGAINTFNQGTNKKSAFGLLADVGVIPNTLNVQVGFMRGKTGLVNASTLAVETDNSYTLGLRYKLAQNAKIGLAYTKFSGNAYELGGSNGALVANGAAMTAGTAATAVGRGNSLLNIIMSTGF